MRIAAARKLEEVGADAAPLEERIRVLLPDLRWDDLATFERKFDDLEHWLKHGSALHPDTTEA